MLHMAGDVVNLKISKAYRKSSKSLRSGSILHLGKYFFLCTQLLFRVLQIKVWQSSWKGKFCGPLGCMLYVVSCGEEARRTVTD